MKKYLLREYIFIFLTATIFLFASYTKSFSDENVFTINNVKVKGTIDLNFNRNKYLNKAFINSFDVLMSKVLLSRDLKKISKIDITEIKNLISSFQILEESYRKDEYIINIKITYNEKKVKKFLGKKNISFSQPENISAIFYPLLFAKGDIINFYDNYFYNEWNKVEVENESINFILPLEDLDDISKIVEMKNRMEDLNVNDLINKYDVKNYIFALMNYENDTLNIHLKINFNDNKISKNISYELKNISDKLELNLIIKDLKLKIADVWKQQNLVNLLMPLSIQLKFAHKDIENLDKARNVFSRINIIENYSLEEFNINNSIFKIYYYGNPKKLRSELSKFGYMLMNNQGVWHLILNE